MKHDYYSAIEKRRSLYDLSKESPISDDRIREIVEHALHHTPSAYNAQSGRAVILLGKEHDRLWDMIEEALRAIVPADKFAATKKKMAAFRNAYGTVMFFEDYEIVEGLQNKFALFKDNFPIWSYQSVGMLQNNVWTAFAIEGLGASLQHYNELVEEAVKKEWNLPANWKMISQMPFGKALSEAGEKSFVEISKKIRVYKD